MIKDYSELTGRIAVQLSPELTKEFYDMLCDIQSVYETEIAKLKIKNDKEIAFNLINTKNVDIKLLKWAYPSVEAYNVKVRSEKDYWWREELTQEEFEFIGRLAGAK